MEGRLVRSKSDRMIAGVCGGLARYFNIDPVIVRLVFVLAVLFGGVSPLIYVVLWIVMPEEGTVPAPPQLNHPRPMEEWKYDPYTGEPIRREP
ncbi:MAG: PspC domain-containing protein [Roseiflexus sp.]|nr:PspC domain-containing protein [Roseiflexus sp.]MCS7289665.1 PspC domain-containing protein [Roseiflexus sp.]MDW8148692.1 PspC domain-containing protein [Roseiflexaceae bacterium]MDW8232405.1 PspC domain-containing protein [Roseiflexaceae bacterium]